MPRKLTIVGALVIATVVLVGYFPAFRTGFYWDDWVNMESVGRLGPSEFALRSLDPRTPDFLYTYRPLQGLLLAMEYPAFGRDSTGYHMVHIALHLVNSLLLCLIVRKLGQNRQIAFLSGLFYASLPVFSMAVFLLSAIDVVATLFYLLAIWSWLISLQTKSKWYFALTITAFVLGLLTKELVVTLPVALFLIDRLFIRDTTSIVTLFRRYCLIVIVLLLYAAFEFSIQPKSTIGGIYGTSFGVHVFTNAAEYMTRLTFPWDLNISYLWVWTLIVVALFTFAAVRTRSALLVFTGIWAVLNILPVLGFQYMFAPRFLYLSGIAPAIWLALIVDKSRQTLRRWNYWSYLASFSAVLFLLLNANGVASAAQEMFDSARSLRTPFRDVAQQHPVFPDDTYLYFIDPPIPLRELSGLFFIKYGENVHAGGSQNVQKAQLRQHKNTLIYYYDSTNRSVEVSIQKDVMTQSLPQVPATFGDAIGLEDYEVSATSIERGKSVVLLLYWRATQKIDKDYTVFVHLVDGNGNVAVGLDSQPARGNSPTTSWNPGSLIVDSIILPIPEDAVKKESYHLEVGLYFLPTMQRLSIVDERGTTVADHINIEYFDIR